MRLTLRRAFPPSSRYAGDRRRLLVALAGLAAAAHGGEPTQASFPIPGRPVRLIVPYPAGGGADALARRLAPALSERLGVPVVVDNRPGGGSVIGALALARSAPDGHTLLLNVPGFLVLLPAQTSRLPYDPWKDFTPITPVISTGLVLECHPSVPARDVHELIAHARAHPGRLAYASWGIGGGSHVFMELLKRRAGIDLLHVPYKGIAEIHPDLLGNRVQLVLDATSQGQHHVRAGALRALGVVGDARVPGLPEVPTFAEQGLEGFDKGLGGLGVFAPAGLPQRIAQGLHQELRAIAADPEIVAFMAGFGFRPFTQEPAAYRATLVAHAAYWKPVIEELGLRLD